MSLSLIYKVFSIYIKRLGVRSFQKDVPVNSSMVKLSKRQN